MRKSNTNLMMNIIVKKYKEPATIHIIIININLILPIPDTNNHNSATKNSNMKSSTSMMAQRAISDSLSEKKIGVITKKANNGSINSREGKD